MSELRKSAVKMRGNAITLVGPEIKVGDTAPDLGPYRDRGGGVGFENGGAGGKAGGSGGETDLLANLYSQVS